MRVWGGDEVDDNFATKIPPNAVDATMDVAFSFGIKRKVLKVRMCHDQVSGVRKDTSYPRQKMKAYDASLSVHSTLFCCRYVRFAVM